MSMRFPSSCLPSGCPPADGTPEQCARRILDQFEAGADGVILHASLPHEVAPALEAWAKIRPAELFRAAADVRRDMTGGGEEPPA